jgi:hypothetical protein
VERTSQALAAVARRPTAASDQVRRVGSPRTITTRKIDAAVVVRRRRRATFVVAGGRERKGT